MGPAGFWAELRSRGLGRPLGSPEVEKLLRGRSVAVDAAVWFYEAQLQPDLAQAYGPAGAVLKVTFDRCARWLRSGVLPIVVLEGSGGGRGDRFFAREGRGALGAAFAAQPRVRALLAALGVPFVDADGEAEAACAALAQASACDFVATTDFDALLFGAPAVLRGLDLRADGRSECEVWEAAGVREAAGLDRDGLICAAFLSGCDYDRRAQGGQAAPKAASSREGAGVRGIGVRRAMSIARALHEVGQGDPVAALYAALADGPLPAAADASVARTLQQGLDLARREPRCIEGFEAVVRRYRRCGPSATVAARIRQGFAWAGVDEGAAVEVLSQVYPMRASAKLLPLHFEWALRRLASDRPAAAMTAAEERRRWAASRGLRYAPLSAKLPKLRSAVVPHALVEWEAIEDGASLEGLPTAARHTRVSLARACGLLEEGGLAATPSDLRAWFNRMLEECPADCRGSAAALREWAMAHGILLAPSGVVALRTGRMRVLWQDAASGQLVASKSLVVEAAAAARFAGVLAGGATARDQGQRSLRDFMRRTSAGRFARRSSALRRSALQASARASGRRAPARSRTPPRRSRPGRAALSPPKLAVPSSAEASQPLGEARWCASSSRRSLFGGARQPCAGVDAADHKAGEAEGDEGGAPSTGAAMLAALLRRRQHASATGEEQTCFAAPAADLVVARAAESCERRCVADATAEMVSSGSESGDASQPQTTQPQAFEAWQPASQPSPPLWAASGALWSPEAFDALGLPEHDAGGACCGDGGFLLAPAAAALESSALEADWCASCCAMVDDDEGCDAALGLPSLWPPVFGRLPVA